MVATLNSNKRFVRHWKERFIPGMALIFIKRLQLDGNRAVNPGDPVTLELRAELGEHRMKMWWNAKVLGAAPPPVEAPPVEAPPPRKEAKGKKG